MANETDTRPQSSPYAVTQGSDAPGSVGGAIRRGGMEAGFQMFGSAVANYAGIPEAAAPIANIGINISNTMQDRWFKQEYENFNASVGQQFKNQSQALVQNLNKTFKQIDSGFYTDEDGNTIKINPQSEDAIRLKNRTIGDVLTNFQQLNDQFFQAAQKYAHNPYVTATVQNMLTTTTSTIKGIVGPTPAEASEKNLAQIALMRRQGEATRAAARGSKKKEGIQTFQDALNKFGPQKAMSYVVSNKRADWLAPWMASAKALFQKQAKQEFEIKNPGQSPSDQQLEDLALQNADKITNLAAGMFANSNVPGFASTLDRLGLKQYLPAGGERGGPPAFVVTTDLSKAKTRQFIDETEDNAIAIMEDFIRRNVPNKYKEVERVAEQWLNQYLKEKVGGSKGAEALRAKVRNEVIRRLKNFARIRFASPIVADYFQSPTKRKGSKLTANERQQQMEQRKRVEGLLKPREGLGILK